MAQLGRQLAEDGVLVEERLVRELCAGKGRRVVFSTPVIPY